MICQGAVSHFVNLNFDFVTSHVNTITAKSLDLLKY